MQLTATIALFGRRRVTPPWRTIRRRPGQRRSRRKGAAKFSPARVLSGAGAPCRARGTGSRGELLYFFPTVTVTDSVSRCRARNSRSSDPSSACHRPDTSFGPARCDPVAWYLTPLVTDIELVCYCYRPGTDLNDPTLIVDELYNAVPSDIAPG